MLGRVHEQTTEPDEFQLKMGLDLDGNQRLCLLRLAMFGPKTITDYAFVSEHPVLGTSLLVGT